MTKDLAYFFAEYAIEFSIWSDLAKTIRELNKNIRLELIFTRESRIDDFNLEKFFSPFDAVHEIDYVSHEMDGRWRKGFTPRNIHHSLTKVFPKARKDAVLSPEMDVLCEKHSAALGRRMAR